MTERRCDGCGELTSNPRTYRDGDRVAATYCYECNELMSEYGVPPGQHRQYKLQEDVGNE